jgi:Mg2+-importing ATPase
MAKTFRHNTSSIAHYWSRSFDQVMAALGASRNGLDEALIAERLQRYGRNTLATSQGRITVLWQFLAHFRNPLVLILVFAAIVALIVHDWLDASIVLAIVVVTAVLSSVQEFRANIAVAKLRQQVSARTAVLRSGQKKLVPSEEVVPGDIVLLSAGSLIPGDGLLLESKDFFVNQAILTGETYPVEKQPGIWPEDASLAQRNNCVFMGTSVRSGTASALIIHTGSATQFGQIADSLALRPPETEFERGLRQFGFLLLVIMVILIFCIMLINIVLQHSTIETFLFAMALAVGLSPEMLPAILTITLARGARAMAGHGVIVKHLNAIENLGSMNVLCTDKTGTLTKGVVKLDSSLDIAGAACTDVLQLAYLNARLQTGLVNPLDEAIIDGGMQGGIDTSNYEKLGEVPYDFIRKRLSIVVRKQDGATASMITKGAMQNILDVCDRVQNVTEIQSLTEESKEQLLRQFAGWSEQGYRVLGIAQKSVSLTDVYTRETEQGMIFRGFLLFFDPPEPGVSETLEELGKLGVQLKIITGDNGYVARHVAQAVGIDVTNIITGAELAEMKDEALWHLAPDVSLFAEVDPNQKERIITALQKTRNVVGYLGDGINDAPALHAADVGISVDTAVDVAKEAADFVLLRHDLAVVCKGIHEGRHTFANTLKYIFVTTSANFGNMISMAVASLFLPFLPLLAKQILLNNFLSDIPAMGIAGDNVDRSWDVTPHRWDIHLVRNFMIVFGLISAVFDLLTFGVLLHMVGEVAEVFRSGWFVESLLTELLILFVIRTYKPFYKSKPGKFLIWSTAVVVVITLMLPYLSIAGLFGIVPIPVNVLAAILTITMLYVVVSEYAKRIFFRRFGM